MGLQAVLLSGMSSTLQLSNKHFIVKLGYTLD